MELGAATNRLKLRYVPRVAEHRLRFNCTPPKLRLPAEPLGVRVDRAAPSRVSIAAVLGGVVTKANAFCCDGGSAIVAFARRAEIAAHVLPRPGKPDPLAPDYHLNNVNAYHSRLKKWLRRFHGVATKNLPNYLGWSRALEALGPSASAPAVILGAMGLGPYQQQTR